MAGTKIVNVSKNDAPEEVIDSLVSADLKNDKDLKEVIFILPKNSKLAKKEQYFQTLKNRSEEYGVKLTMMTSDKTAIEFASANGIEVIEKSRKKPVIKTDKPEHDGNKKLAEEIGTEAESVPEDKDSDEGSSKTVLNNPDDYLEKLIASGAAYEVDSGDKREVVLAAAHKNNHRNEGAKIINDIIPPSNVYERIAVEEDKSKAEDLPISMERYPQNIESAQQHKGAREDYLNKMWLGSNTDATSKKEGKSKHSFKTGGGYNKKILIPILILVPIVLFVASFTVPGSAKVLITPQKEDLSLQIVVTGSMNISAVDFSSNKIPGQKFNETKDISESFKATGRKEVAQKAYGEITIYNTSSSAQSLVATTRFESPEGFIFRIPQTIIIPPANASSGSEVVPGSAKSKVIADKAGAEYNIGPSRFTIPGFDGTARFSQFYATSDSSMKGGIIGPSSVVTEQDFASAQVSLSAKLKDEITNSLKNKVGELELVYVDVNLGEPKSDVEAGTAADNFNISISWDASAIAYKIDDLFAVINHNKLSNSNSEVVKESFKIEYLNNNLSENKEELTFTAKVSGQSVKKINAEKIKADIKGLGQYDAEQYFKKLDAAEKVRIVLFPFWTRVIPDNQDKINITLEN